jgi:hypothetical protein
VTWRDICHARDSVTACHARDIGHARDFPALSLTLAALALRSSEIDPHTLPRTPLSDVPARSAVGQQALRDHRTDDLAQVGRVEIKVCGQRVDRFFANPAAWTGLARLDQ